MKSIQDLAGAHSGRSAVVIGGGPSAPEQLKQCPSSAVYISANQHGCLLKRCDYIYCKDGIEQSLQRFRIPIISPRPVADYQFEDQPVVGSGPMAAWCAWLMGCAPIVLVGMDCYQDPRATSPGRDIPLHRHLKRWVPLVALTGNKIRVFSGPLVGLFLLYEGNPSWL